MTLEELKQQLRYLEITPEIEVTITFTRSDGRKVIGRGQNYERALASAYYWLLLGIANDE